jgi:hypothetical protein
MAEEQPQVTVPATLTRVRDQQYRELYSNVTQTQMGPYDITILIQKATEIVPGVPGVIDQCAVSFSPQHFKALVRGLNETLAAYEQSFGELTISDADTAPKRTAAEISSIIDEARKSGQLNPLTSSTEQPPLSKRSRGAAQKKEP